MMLRTLTLIIASVLAVQIVANCPRWSLRDLVRMSPIILEATVVSHSGLDIVGSSHFHVTFKVRKVWKQQSDKPYVEPYVKLNFNQGSCPHKMPRQQLGKIRHFLLFVKDNHQLMGHEAIVSPLRRTRRAKKALKRALCQELHQYCQQPKQQLKGEI